MPKSYNIIDQRTDPKGRSSPNRQRFIAREKQKIKEAVAEHVKKGNIEDLSRDGKKQRVKIHSKDEPSFHHGKGGITDRVHPGNKKFQKGDRIPRPKSGKQRGKEGAPDGDGEDSFYFELSYDEWLDALFDGMEIPNQIKKSLSGDDLFELQRAGFESDGPQSKMDITRTGGRAMARRKAFRAPHLRKKHELEAELRALEARLANPQGEDVVAIAVRIEEIHKELLVLERKLKSVPFLDTFDLRFRRHELVPIPVTKAVMFCILDVSGSMGEWEKEMAKRFFILMHLFLLRNYERVKIVFIRHTTTAKEVDEKEFFHARDTGGTMVSSALELMKAIIKERFPVEEWNIYGCHASDGDNFAQDNVRVLNLMETFILPTAQYYAYVEVRQKFMGNGQLWPIYEELLKGNPNLAINHIRDKSDIYPVFRKLFEKGAVKHEQS